MPPERTQVEMDAMTSAGRLAGVLLGSLAACSSPSGVSDPPPARAGLQAVVRPAQSAAVSPERLPAVLERCEDSPQVALFTSPRSARAGGVLRVIAVSEQAQEGVLVVRGPGGAVLAESPDHQGGPPYSWVLEIPAPVAGTARAILTRGPDVLGCKDISIADPIDPPSDRDPAGAARAAAFRVQPHLPSGAWTIRSSWGRALENLYSVWIERLFDAPVDEQLTFAVLQDALSDPRRNLLHNHLGIGDDESPPPGAPRIDPDCADLPYVLRAYFAYKMGLPFGYSSCTRGGGGQPPSCLSFRTSLKLSWAGRRNPFRDFVNFLRVDLADTVHSGSGRVPASADRSDYYSVPLSAESLRPGTVYADPYGHVLVVVRRIAQTESSGGILLAVDGQPDGTVARRRYWRGNFLFSADPALGSPGFKRLRPVVLAGGILRALRNEEISAHPEYGDYSMEQYQGGVEGFYDRVDDVLSPAPLDPMRALRETIDALHEQVKGRVLSVNNGTKHRATSTETVEMPDDATIFETVGPWEDFSTPSRDLRLLIAIDIVRGFPDRVARRPQRFSMPPGKPIPSVKAELEAMLRSELDARRFAYERSDGSSFPLSLSDLLGRQEALEMAYNPNDCAEIRWGALPGSEEAKTCRGRAPADQRAKMRQYRPWFHERRRPPR